MKDIPNWRVVDLSTLVWLQPKDCKTCNGKRLIITQELVGDKIEFTSRFCPDCAPKLVEVK